MPGRYCIMCGKQRNGIEIKSDRVLEAIRWFKRNVTKDEKRNTLVVCKECYSTYKKNRDRYTSRQALYAILGFLFAVFSLLLSPQLTTVLLCIIIFAVLYLLSLLNYTPALSIKETKANRSA